MASKRDVCSYFSVISENVIKDFRVWIFQIIISAPDDVSWNYLNVPQKVRNEVGRFALINGLNALI